MDADSTQISRPAPPDAADYPLSELTERIIGAAYEVHSELGPGFLEKVYETALARELAERGMACQPQAEIPVSYKGQRVGLYYADLLIDGCVICEVKAVEALSEAHKAQLLHYLKATGLQVGLLLNFGSDRVQVKRVVRTR